MSTSFYGDYLFSGQPLPGKKTSAARFSEQKAFASSETNISEGGSFKTTMKEDQGETKEINKNYEMNLKKS